MQDKRISNVGGDAVDVGHSLIERRTETRKIITFFKVM